MTVVPYKPRMVWNRMRGYWVCYGKGVHGVDYFAPRAYYAWAAALKRQLLGAS